MLGIWYFLALVLEDGDDAGKIEDHAGKAGDNAGEFEEDGR